MIAVRLVVAAVGALLALLPGRGAVAPERRARTAPPPPPPPPEAAAPPLTSGMRIARALLIAAGALATGVAFGLIASGVPAGQWIGIAIWLAGALVLHDGILAVLLLVAMRVLRTGRAVLPWRAIAAVEVVLVVAGVLTLLAFPAVRAQAIGARNPSVLVFDYGAHLAVVWAVAGALVVIAVVAGVLARRRSAEPHAA